MHRTPVLSQGRGFFYHLSVPGADGLRQSSPSAFLQGRRFCFASEWAHYGICTMKYVKNARFILKNSKMQDMGIWELFEPIALPQNRRVQRVPSLYCTNSRKSFEPGIFLAFLFLFCGQSFRFVYLNYLVFGKTTFVNEWFPWANCL